MQHKNIILMLIMAFCIVFSIDAEAQTKRKRTSKRAEKKETKKKEVKEDSDPENDVVFFRDLMNYEMKIGNIGFFNGFSLSTKINAGYKLNNHLTTGLGAKLFYDQFIVSNGPDISYFDRGVFAFARGKVTQEIYLQAEYHHTVYDQINFTESVNYPTFGAGYMSGFGKWKFGLELLYIANDRARDLQNSVVEYWVGAAYNF
ncbi:MAG: hypothetical protein IPM42_04270 [Saprospiraceae bacterium]|nr:hypothetical protein [Saprospiraceae bacterium]